MSRFDIQGDQEQMSRTAVRTKTSKRLFVFALLPAVPLSGLAGHQRNGTDEPLIADSCGQNYNWAGYEATNFANEGTGGYIRGIDVFVPQPTKDHVLLYVSSNSLADGSNAQDKDWVQVGYGEGAVDAAQANGYEVYEEAEDYNQKSGPVAHFFATDPIGNQFFETFFVDQVDSKGGGLYEGFENSTYLGEAWSVSPTKNQFFGQSEIFHCSGDDTPTIDFGLFGTNGDYKDNPPTYSTSTELFIMQDGGSSVVWSPSVIASARNGTLPVQTYKADSAFDGY